MSSDIIKKIKLLKKISPDNEWKKSSRELLMMAIRGDADRVIRQETWAQELAKILFSWRVLRLSLRPALTLFALFGLVLGSGLSVSASQSALPGDALYPLKLATEKMQVAVTFKKEEQTKLHVELAGKRIDEVKKIKANPLPPQNKNKKINVAIDKFQQEITAVQNKLENLKKTKVPQVAVVEVAKIVNKKANEYQEVLTETTADPEVFGEVALKLNQGLSMIEELSKQAKQIVEVALLNDDSRQIVPESKENIPNCNTNLVETQQDARNTNISTEVTSDSASSPEEKETTNTNTLENVNVNPLPKKVYIKSVTPVNTNTNTAVEPEPEEVDESQLKVGIDLRQEPTQ